jgi:hypothetical protein
MAPYQVLRRWIWQPAPLARISKAGRGTVLACMIEPERQLHGVLEDAQMASQTLAGSSLDKLRGAARQPKLCAVATDPPASDTFIGFNLFC